jgi:hypothetical protein
VALFFAYSIFIGSISFAITFSQKLANYIILPPTPQNPSRTTLKFCILLAKYLAIHSGVTENQLSVSNLIP